MWFTILFSCFFLILWNQFFWKLLFVVLNIHEPSLVSCEVPHNIWAWSVQPFIENKRTSKVFKYLGYPTKQDSWWIVLNVFFHILYWKIIIQYWLFAVYFVKKNWIKYILLWNQFYYNMTSKIQSHIFFFLFGIKEFRKFWKKIFKIFTYCKISWGTLYLRAYLVIGLRFFLPRGGA